ncbi:MAG TPA: glycosyltransferase [Sphingomicrobium sp.]|nr:glycosyltransferase [Sphingomicrobium sp.]
MRILVVIHDFQPGGVERIAIRLASRWASDGAEVVLVCGSTAGALRPLLDERVSLEHPLREIHRSRFSRTVLAAFAARTARTCQPDVLFLPGNYYLGAAAVLKLALGPKCPPIVSKLSNALRRADRSPIRQLFFERTLRWKVRFSDHLVYMSPELQAEGREVLGDARFKSHAIEEPILEDQFTCPDTASNEVDPIELIAAGRLVAQKNFRMLIDAVSMLASPVRLSIYGEGPDRSDLETKVKSLGLERDISLPGYSSDLPRLLAQSRLFVLSSDYEGYPAVVIEALAAGVPVIATDCSPAMRAILRSAGLDTLIAVGDASGFAAAIDAQLNGPRPDPEKLAKSVARFRLGRSAKAYSDLFSRA